MLFLDFLRKKEKTGEKTGEKLGEISVNSCSFLRFLCLLSVFGLFSWCFLLVFFGFLRRNGAIERISAPFSLFLAELSPFLSVLSLLWLLLFWRATKTAIFKQNNDEKRNIWKIVPVFSFSVFCSGYFYMNFCVFCENRV